MRLRFLVTQCLTGVCLGVGAAVLESFCFALMPGSRHSGHGPATGPPDEVLFIVLAALGFPILGAILGVLGGTDCADRRRSRGLWLGAALGTAVGLGLIGLFPFLRGASRYYHDEKLRLCFVCNFGCAVFGSVLGGVIARRPQAGNALIAGTACGAGAGGLASLLLLTANLDRSDQIICGGYIFVGFAMAGALVGVLSRPDHIPRWAWAALPALLLWGPALEFVASHGVVQPPETPARNPTSRQNVFITVHKDGLTIYDGLNVAYSRGVGPAGTVETLNFPPPTSMMLAWPAPRQFEVTLDFDPGKSQRGLKVEVDADVPGSVDVKATLDQGPAALPVKLPLGGGKHRLVIKGRFP
jgi:hypothetical protein